MNVVRSLLAGILLCGAVGCEAQAIDQKQDHAWAKAVAIGAAHGATFSLGLYVAKPIAGDWLVLAGAIGASGLIANCNAIVDRFLGREYREIADTAAFAACVTLGALYIKALNSQK